MENHFFAFLKRNFGESHKIRVKNNSLTLVCSFYIFRLKKVEDNYQLSYLWKLGLLRVLYTKQYQRMTHIHNTIINYSIENNMNLVELNYNINFLPYFDLRPFK